MKISTHIGNALVQSPMNYIGGKGKLLPQILPLFPSDLDTVHDLFAGGGNVGVNLNCKKLHLNDLNKFVVEILETFYREPLEVLLDQIEAYISKYKLSKENADGFLKCRKDYNENHNPMQLYTLICYSFNYQFRFNSNHEYNNPFGRDRSHFSERLREKLIRFVTKLKEKEVSFSAIPFEEYISSLDLGKRDFFYCDPPYLITTGSYNDGHRGFKHWGVEQEKKLLNVLSDLDKNGIRFALSNVLRHKGKENDLLIAWSKKYNMHSLDKSYSNSSYNTSRLPSEEVLITNY